jgi:hypothetical protein
MTGSPPLAPVIPLRPDAPTPAARGWHGMQARDQASYRPEDWRVWGALGNDDARLIDVTPGSPAWLADLRDGAWITAINGQPFEDFSGGLAGQIIEVRALLAGIGPVVRQLVLAAPPARAKKPVRQAEQKRQPAWKLLDPVPPGKRVYKDTRARYLEYASRHPFARKHVWFLTELLKRDWKRGIIPRHKTIAEAVGCSVSTVKRAQTCCEYFGFVRVASGQRSHRHNTYEVCWPDGSD